MVIVPYSVSIPSRAVSRPSLPSLQKQKSLQLSQSHQNFQNQQNIVTSKATNATLDQRKLVMRENHPILAVVTPRQWHAVVHGLMHLSTCKVGCKDPICLSTQRLIQTVRSHRSTPHHNIEECVPCVLWARASGLYQLRKSELQTKYSKEAKIDENTQEKQIIHNFSCEEQTHHTNLSENNVGNDLNQQKVHLTEQKVSNNCLKLEIHEQFCINQISEHKNELQSANY